MIASSASRLLTALTVVACSAGTFAACGGTSADDTSGQTAASAGSGGANAGPGGSASGGSAGAAAGGASGKSGAGGKAGASGKAGGAGASGAGGAGGKAGASAGSGGSAAGSGGAGTGGIAGQSGASGAAATGGTSSAGAGGADAGSGGAAGASGTAGASAGSGGSDGGAAGAAGAGGTDGGAGGGGAGNGGSNGGTGGASAGDGGSAAGSTPAGGAGGSAGGSAGAAGTGGSASSLFPHGDCATDADCPGGACVTLAPSVYKVCQTPVVGATSCTGGTDTCCKNADCLVPGEHCITAPLQPYCGGAVMPAHNECAKDQCTPSVGCAAGSELCVPAGALGYQVAACMSTACTQDSDCGDAPGGECVVVRGSCCDSHSLACAYPPDGCRSGSDCQSGEYCAIQGARARCIKGFPICPG